MSFNVLWTTDSRRIARRLSPITRDEDGAKVLMHLNSLPIDWMFIQY